MMAAIMSFTMKKTTKAVAALLRASATRLAPLGAVYDRPGSPLIQLSSPQVAVATALVEGSGRSTSDAALINRDHRARARSFALLSDPATLALSCEPLCSSLGESPQVTCSR